MPDGSSEPSALPDGGYALSGLRFSAADVPCRPDKRSAIRQNQLPAKSGHKKTRRSGFFID
ncbi:hypothetical protein EQG67_00790 [Kosakonia cowanii]|nr:hypothetical protein EQG67_00790 [Kosakonia cowanii]